ncbi:hypothetical protein ACX93W_04395 [Paenibacillus sp. CAU 1782]
MESRNGTDHNKIINKADDELFLRGIYRKASVLECERRENERVLINRKKLRKQWLIRMGVTMAAVIGFILILTLNSFDRVAVLMLSSILLVLGLLLEHMELRTSANKE